MLGNCRCAVTVHCVVLMLGNCHCAVTVQCWWCQCLGTVAVLGLSSAWELHCAVTPVLVVVIIAWELSR